MRIDKLMWFLRLTKTRSLAQTIVGAGHIRLNGRRIDRAHIAVDVGDVLVIPLGAAVRVIEVLALPLRRGPASEAQACYRLLGGDRVGAAGPGTGELDVAGDSPIAAGAINYPAERDLQP